MTTPSGLAGIVIVKEVIEMTKIIGFLVAVVAVALSVAPSRDAVAARGDEVADLIGTLEVGEPVYYENLTIIPVYTTRTSDNSPYTTLDEAVDNKWLEITEVEGGRVPQVKVTNHSDRYIFLMGGEILTGCRQDRLVGRDVLLGPKSKDVIVPVYCVEHGRWTYESSTFSSKKNLGTVRLRAESQKGAGDAQTNIWSEVSQLGERAGAPSATDRFQSVFESETARRKIGDLEARLGTIPDLYPDVTGVIVGVGPEITSVDIFATPSLFARLWPKILKSSALADLGHDSYHSITQSDAIDFLRELHEKQYAEKPAVDLGFELSAVDYEVNVNALVYRNAVIHVAGFPEAHPGHGEKPRDPERRIPVIRRP